MDVLRKFPFIFFFFALSCSQLDYGFRQGVGQLGLLWGSIPNEEALSSSAFSQEDKRKIRLVEEYKHFFYRYWQMPAQKIYSKSYKLKHEAVTYLVITSPKNKIEATNNCFPLVGCFPYLGFFDPADARKHAEAIDQKHFVSWTRPVYAYSTLGNFDDPILSSFFYYDDVELANLVFHELFHTIFFISDEVEFNENLANFFAEKMVDQYFIAKKQINSPQLKKYKEDTRWLDAGLKQLVDFAHQLNGLYSNSKSDVDVILEDFKRETIIPWSREYCRGHDDCWAARLDYNNASLAAYLTYESQDEFIEKWFNQQNQTLLQFLAQLRQFSEDFKKQKSHKVLSEYLKYRFNQQ